MNDKTASIAFLVLGVVILLGSLLADVIGLGDDEGFGRQQTIGSIVGAAVTGVGVFFTTKKIK